MHRSLIFFWTKQAVCYLSFALAFAKPSESIASIRKADAQFVVIRGHQFQVEVMRTDAEWSKGLMFRERLGAREGMLFFGKIEQPRSFWMKNTYVPLDIIFISKDRKIVDIGKNATPLSEATIPSKAPAMHVLEVLAGTSDKLGFQPGDKVEFKIKN
ncbi:MAG: hypothetical protein COV44_06035 [Deltaproteobacteria bacterium CG11_big_fil_rev_8_21_14_0_20_45_16]|nr:MAG: hypothetical protein COV44_06035 [Deltaproteobacteria bacterium CG11_big_fil_rev_8_21_14_0_20_45_16]